MTQPRTHVKGVSAPRQRQNATTEQATGIHPELFVLLAITTSRSMTEAPTRRHSSARPAAPAGNIEKSLCTYKLYCRFAVMEKLVRDAIG